MIRRRPAGMVLAACGGVMLFFGLRQRAARRRELLGGVAGESGIRIEKSIDIAAPREDVFAFWRKLSNLPSIMSHLREVQMIDDQYSRWVASGPAGTSVEWYAEIINERPDEMIAWKSIPGADCANAGSVRFAATLEGGTHIDLKLEYRPPIGQLGGAFAALFGASAEHQISEDLERFKARMEEEHLRRSSTALDSMAAEVAADTGSI